MNMEPGQLYVILFKNGLVKVGRSADASGRVKQHAAMAAIHDNPMVTYWTGDTVEDVIAAEKSLIEFCTNRAENRGWEWFIGLDFFTVVEFARALGVVMVDEKALKEARLLVLAADKVRVAQRTDLASMITFSEGNKLNSSTAYNAYLANTTDEVKLTQMQFVKAMQELGIKKRRTSKANVYLDVAIAPTTQT